MIELDTSLFSKLLQSFSLPSEIRSWTPITNNQKQLDGMIRVRIIVSVCTASGKHFIVKIIREQEHPPGLINRQSLFSERLRNAGIPVPKRYALATGEYVTEQVLEDVNCAVTIEDKIGAQELEFINSYYVKELAKLMADMHIVAERENLLVHHGTIWDFYNPQADISKGFLQFCELPSRYPLDGIDFGLYTSIKEMYLDKQRQLAAVWGLLPRFAVQGDFSTNNIMLDEAGAIQAVIDFNIAGDEVLVNDFVTEGIFICYIMDLEPGLPEEIRAELLQLFMATYIQHRKLSTEEEYAAKLIYQLLFPFWWTRVEELEEQFKNGHIEGANQNLRDMNRLQNETWNLL